MKSASGLTAGKLDLAWLEGTSDRKSSFFLSLIGVSIPQNLSELVWYSC